jgi:hypothetical protein
MSSDTYMLVILALIPRPPDPRVPAIIGSTPYSGAGRTTT